MENYDVIICGGGCAGFCAAVASARTGAKTALVERYNCPGGILTVLGNGSIVQFNNPYIEENKMVITGIGWEFILRLYKDGYANMPDMDSPCVDPNLQYAIRANPVACAKNIDDMLIESGVELYYGQPVVDVCVQDEKIEYITIATRSGLKKLKASVYIDCTGDGEIAAFAGNDFLSGNGNGVFQPGTLRYYPAVDAKDKILYYGDNLNQISLNSTDSDAITNAEIQARRLIFEQMQNGERILGIAPAVAPREGRRIKGITQMNEEDFCSGKLFDDSVCYSYWFVDIHRDNEPDYIRYIKSPNTPTIRLTSMIASDVKNLMMAGRCVSSDRITNGVLRVKASCMAMGQAAGTAAALAADAETDVMSLPLSDIKAKLAKDGAVVPGVTGTVAFKDAH